MGINVVSIKCPACGAELSAEEGREFLFCAYCGTKVRLNNDNEYVYRNIDEARLKEAETDRMVAMRQLDMEEKTDKSGKVFWVLWFICLVILTTVGIIGLAIENEGLGFCILFAMYVGIFGFYKLMDGPNKKKKKAYVGANDVEITGAMINSSDSNYRSKVLLYKGAGFVNVVAIPLNDLNLLRKKKDGVVDEITINGRDDFEEGDVFPKTSNVLITYHSL